MKPRGPKYNLQDMNGPNAESLKAALQNSKTEAQRRAQAISPAQIEEEIADFERSVAAIHTAEDTASKPAPDAESRAAADASQDEYAWIHDERIAGEPDHRMPFWNLGHATETDWLRNQLSATKHAIRWLRAETVAARDALRGIEQHSATATAMKKATVAILADLLPMARRNAKRGKPALLRLITKAIKTKL